MATRLEASATQSTSEKTVTTTTTGSKSSLRASGSASPAIVKEETQVLKESVDAPKVLPLAKSPSPPVDKTAETSFIPPLVNGKLPNSDAEFAAIMGLLDTSDFDSLKAVSFHFGSFLISLFVFPSNFLRLRFIFMFF